MKNQLIIREELFNEKSSNRHIQRRSMRGGIMVATSKFIKFIITFFSTAILARLLAPSDYGLFAMAAVIIEFARVFRDGGLSTATIQRDVINHRLVSSLFWINTIIGLVIMILLISLSSVIAGFFGYTELEYIIISLSFSFAISGLSIQHESLMRRQLRFKSIAIIEIISSFVGATGAIVIAKLGYGYWALVSAPIVMSIFQTICIFLVLPWRPSFPRQDSELMSMISFGKDILIFQFVNYFSRQADNVFIGKYWGAEQLGFYGKAYSLVMAPIVQINAPVSSVIIPALSRIKNNKEKYSKLFLGALQLIYSITIPLIIILVIFSSQIVSLWLGPNWTETAILFKLLGVAAVCGALLNPIGWILIAEGRTNLYKWIGIINAIVIVIAFILGTPFGARGIAMAYSISTLILVFPTWYYVLRDTHIKPAKIFSPVMLPIISSAASACIALILINYGMVEYPLFISLLAGISCFIIFYLFVLLVVFSKLNFYKNILHELFKA